MNLDDLLDASRELLARSGADEWEVVASRGQEVSLAVRGEELDKFQESVTQGVAFRVIKDGHLGFTYLLGGEPADLKRAVGQALAAAEANDFRQETGFAAPGEVYPAVETHDPALAAEPLAAFCLRPFLSVLVTPRNALALARWSLVGLGLALCGYPFARGIEALLLVRLCHGVAFVCLVSAVTVLLAQAIPRTLAGRAFGYFSLSALVPYAVMPPLAEGLLPVLGREDRVYACCAVFVLPALALLAPLGRRLGRRAMAGVAGTSRPTVAQVRQTLASPSVRLILLATLFLFLGTTLIFFFIKPFAGASGGRQGLFFTVPAALSHASCDRAGLRQAPKETCCSPIGRLAAASPICRRNRQAGC